jgi:hypothetical protein
VFFIVNTIDIILISRSLSFWKVSDLCSTFSAFLPKAIFLKISFFTRHWNHLVKKNRKMEHLIWWENVSKKKSFAWSWRTKSITLRWLKAREVQCGTKKYSLVLVSPLELKFNHLYLMNLFLLASWASYLFLFYLIISVFSRIWVLRGLINFFSKTTSKVIIPLSKE